MQKIIAMGSVLLCFLSSLGAWDEEKDLESEIYIPGIGKNVLHFRLGDPLHVTNDFNLSVGLVLNPYWKLSVIGSFENQVLSSVNDISREYHSNPDGTLGGISRERKESSFTAGPIRNLIRTYVGYVAGDNMSMGFSLGFGLDYSKWHTVDMKYDHNFTTSGLINIINPGLDDNRLNSKRFVGEIPIKLGYGFSLLNQPFVKRTDDVVDNKELFYSLGRLNSSHRLHFGILGAGNAPSSLPVLNASGISLAPFNGGGDQFTSERIFIQDNSNLLKSYTVANNESFSWFKVRYDGMVEAEIDLNKWEVPEFQSWYRIRFIPELGAWFELKLYGQTIDQNATYYYESIFGHIDGDYNIRTTTYNMAPEFDFGVNLPFELDFRPVKAVQVRFQYIPKLGFHILNYTARYSENHIQNGVNVSFVDPLLTGSFFRMDHDHTAGVRFRFEPVPEFRFTLNASWTLATYFETTQLKATDNVRKTQNSSGPGPYTQIPAQNDTIGGWSQTVSSGLVMDFALVPNFANLTMSWEPKFTIANSQDSNVFNLANWKLQAVITYDGATARNMNGLPAESISEDLEEDLMVETFNE